MSLRLLESKEFLKYQDGSIKSKLFMILEYVLIEYPEAFKNVHLKLINIIYEDENIVNPIGDFIIKAY